jgi:hypothetical protein
MDKLTIVCRANIPPGYQVAQSCHAVAAFSVKYPQIFSLWAEQVKNIACLSVWNEAALQDLAKLAELKGIPYACFYEPDLGDELTSIALGEGGHRIASCLPLALKAKVPVDSEGKMLQAVL